MLHSQGERYSSQVATERLEHWFDYEVLASEGRTVEVPYRGDVENTIRDVLGGLRSTCTYVGAAKLKELSRRTT
ncbi:unnamed protein product [Pleuronectes platessa]|uniref:GMP reductase n=1 Tax=Pleuronectes platessa TaxID=8262 RepID=A0A9N7UB76_PLEPL|nr:unnamed protein product [Pleuronectes platessa]